MTFPHFLDRVRHLKVDKSAGKPKPYKPLLLASVVILIHKGEIRSRDVYLDGGLRSVFEQLLRAFFPGDFPAANIRYPFRHLATDGIWTLVPRHGSGDALRASLDQGGAAWQVLRHVACAQLDPDVFAALASSFENRFTLLQTLIQTYDLPLSHTGFLWNLLSTEKPPVVRYPDPRALTEKAVEEHLEQHWDETEFASMGIELARVDEHGLPGRQVLTPRNTIDLLGYREREREWWVFELKKGRSSDAVVGQIGRYMGWVVDGNLNPGHPDASHRPVGLLGLGAIASQELASVAVFG